MALFDVRNHDVCRSLALHLDFAIDALCGGAEAECFFDDESTGTVVSQEADLSLSSVGSSTKRTSSSFQSDRAPFRKATSMKPDRTTRQRVS